MPLSFAPGLDGKIETPEDFSADRLYNSKGAVMHCIGGSSEDMVNHPAHYTRGKVECIDAIEAATEGLSGIAAYCTGQVVKYIWRWPWKGKKLEDLQKCRWYLDRLIAYVESEERDVHK